MLEYGNRPIKRDKFLCVLCLPRLSRSSGRWYWGEIHDSDSEAYLTGAISAVKKKLIIYSGSNIIIKQIC